MNEADEKLDLVNGHDEVIGGITRGEIKGLFATTDKYVRYANCFVKNTEGKLWIPRRTADKTIAPNGFDFSASEHVQAGESYLEAIVRGLQEELNMQVGAAVLKCVGKLTPIDGKRPYFSSIFTVEQADAPDFNEEGYNREDFTGYEWLSPTEILDRLDQGKDVAKDDLAPAIRLLVSQ